MAEEMDGHAFAALLGNVGRHRQKGPGAQHLYAGRRPTCGIGGILRFEDDLQARGLAPSVFQLDLAAVLGPAEVDRHRDFVGQPCEREHVIGSMGRSEKHSATFRHQVLEPRDG